MPLPIDEAEAANTRWLRKPVLESRVLDDMEKTNAWIHHGQGTMSFTQERAKEGKQSVRLVSRTITDQPNKVVGRPFGEAVVRRNVGGENWTNYNRLSFWVYPHLPGFKVSSLLVKLRNEGETPVPDSYNREGLHFVLVKPDQWNQVVWEIAHLARDKVTGVELIYRLQGNEPGATNQVCFDFDQLELQRVAPDHVEGWAVAPGRIAYSHSGYLPKARKVAIASDLAASEFKLVRQDTGKAVLAKPVERRETSVGVYQLLDFSSVAKPGNYRLEAGEVRTPWFTISEHAWNNTIWKTINFFYCERCGTPVAGIHDACHRDWRARHGDKELFINGGWHDAGDLSQGLVNTAEATYAMMELAERCRTQDPALAQQLIAEARWGLDWVLKTRFGDGTRVTWATMDYWTDGVLGTVDDTLGDARNSAYENYIGAATEALAARVWKRGNPELATRCLKAAREDWQFANEKLGQSPNSELAAAATLASLELFLTTQEQAFADKAAATAKVLLESQQRTWTEWEVPLAGFFYTSPKRDRILHYAHRGHEQAPVVALAGLCQALPNHPDWMQWYTAVVLHSEYLKLISEYTAPFGMLPASVYAANESKDPRYQEQVRNGIKLSEQHYLRRFPVWFDFRGNLGTVLSQTKGLATAARLRNDATGLALAQQQLEWTVGRNPFGQSLMYGEGHDYTPQYTAMSGDMAGSLPVGIQTRENLDQPYWPTANCYNYAEVWVHPSSRWLWVMADMMAPAQPMAQSQKLTFQVSSQPIGDNKLKITALISGDGLHRLTLRSHNLKCESPEKGILVKKGGPAKPVTWEASLVGTNEPWVGVIIPDGNVSARQEIVGFTPPGKK